MLWGSWGYKIEQWFQWMWAFEVINLKNGKPPVRGNQRHFNPSKHS